MASTSDADLTAADLREVVAQFRRITPQFPTDPHEQLRMAVEAVFASWNGRRAVDYRTAAKIPHDLGTAVNVQAMVFGNLGDRSATGVAMTRSGATGAPGLEGDFLINAQGEDVVSGTRATRPIHDLGAGPPRGLRAAPRNRRQAGDAVPRHAGHRVHRRRRPPVAAADPRRQTDRRRGRPDRRRPGR